MKTKRIVAIIVMLALVAVCCLAACKDPNVITEGLTDEALSGTKIADFSEGSAEAVFATDGWTNGDVFNVWWTKKNVTYSDGAMHLSITDKDASLTACDYYGGEARTYQTFGYGDFEVKMKPVNKTGTASTFFTYSGPESEDDTTPHDEIDIEFLGKDTTKVQFNYFVNGQGGHEYMYNLGFDASKEFHTYGFRWAQNSITWFVDGKPVYKVLATDNNPLPSTPGRIMMNYWCGNSGAKGWMGRYSGPDGESADYQWVATSATAIGEIPEPDVIDPSDIPTNDWVDISYNNFGGWSGYTIDRTNGLTISHSAAMKGWACEGMSLSDSYSWVKFTIKNNETVAAAVRVDIKKSGDGDNGTGGIAAVYCADDDVISYDAEQAAAAIELSGGQTADIVLKIKDMTVDQFVLFLNSMQETDGIATGSITITNLKGIVTGGGGNQQPGGDTPTGESVELWFAAHDVYNITPAATNTKSITVTYENLVGGDYKNITANIANLANGKTTFSVKIKNNGTAAVNIRIDINGTSKSGNGTAINVSSTANGAATNTDTDWGGSYVTVNAGDEVVFVINYDTSTARGAATDLLIFMDSFTSGTYSGNVTFSEFTFYTKSSGGTGSDSSTIPTDGWTDIDYSAFADWGGYTVDKNNGLAISHSTAMNNWKCGGMSLANSYSWVKFTITNTGTGAAAVRIDVKKQTPSAGGVVAVYCATDGVVELDASEAAAKINLAVGQSVEVVLKISDSVAVDQFVVFLNSLQGEGGVASGSITITDLQGILK